MTRYNTGNSVQFIQFIFQSNFSIKIIQHRGIGPILFAGTLTQRQLFNYLPNIDVIFHQKDLRSSHE